jgi:hypothetical protein
MIRLLIIRVLSDLDLVMLSTPDNGNFINKNIIIVRFKGV